MHPPGQESTASSTLASHSTGTVAELPGPGGKSWSPSPPRAKPVFVPDPEDPRLNRLAQPGTDAVGLVDPYLHVAALSSLVPCCPGGRELGPASPGRRR